MLESFPQLVTILMRKVFLKVILLLVSKKKFFRFLKQKNFNSLNLPFLEI